ncbi:transcriptional regulator GlxA family with amidase domain [Cytobacillus purgationiresistens]|uniref:Transcriptional regulator GlxA family with amidase domain n=1 Tax=Cytobacillus purgationiresistens TaxID=863449 RepID=A0ABU0APT4_9BACI|nr:transcriptional regulator GlxA family with amidase domain [Cytobacillus purgationiresistens]
MQDQFEVFSLTISKNKDKAIHVKTISKNGKMVSARNGLKVQPDYSFANHPSLDIVIIPGGNGAEEIEIHNKQTIKWIRKQNKNASFMTSVCTGALLLAEADLLNVKKATTHWMDIPRPRYLSFGMLNLLMRVDF